MLTTDMTPESNLYRLYSRLPEDILNHFRCVGNPRFVANRRRSPRNTRAEATALEPINSAGAKLACSMAVAGVTGGVVAVIVGADEILSAFVELEREVLTATFYLESI